MKKQYLRQVAFAKLVGQKPSRINILIGLGELEVKEEHGLTLVADTPANIKRAKKKSK